MRKSYISKFEILFQFLIVIWTVFSVGWSVSMWKIQGECFAPSDFNTFREAAHGHFVYQWIYQNYTLPIFHPLLWFNPTTAYLLLVGLSAICYMSMAHYLFRVKYGWFVMLLSFKSYHDLMQVGNIDIILAFLYIVPLSALLGVLLKPHHIIFAIIHAIRGLYIKTMSPMWWCIYLLLSGFCLYVSFPSSYVWNVGLNQGVLFRGTLMIYLPTVYYIAMSSTNEKS